MCSYPPSVWPALLLDGACARGQDRTQSLRYYLRSRRVFRRPRALRLVILALEPAPYCGPGVLLCTACAFSSEGVLVTATC